MMKYLVLLSVFLCATAGHGQSLVVSPSVIVWSKVPNADTLVRAFAVKNTASTDQAGQFSNVVFPFSVIEGNAFSIPAGVTDSFHILFVPNGALGGNWQDTISLVTSGSAPYAQLIINASRYNVNTGNVQYSTLDVDFGTIMAGTLDTQYVIAKNVGSTVLRVSADALAHTGPFARFGKPINSRAINAGDSLLIGIQFMPMAAGAFHDTLKTFSNDLDHPNVNIALHGKATPALGVRELVADIMGVFPSVVNSNLILRCGPTGNAQVRVVDLLGREVVRESSRSNGESVDVRSLPCGVYVAILKTSAGVTSYRFVVDR